MLLSYSKHPLHFTTTEVYYHINNGLPLVTILGWMNLSSPFQPISLIPISILSFHLCTDMPSDLFPSDISMKTLYLFSPTSATHSVHLMLTESYQNFMWSKSHKTPHNAIFPGLLLFPPSKVKIFSSAPCFRTISSKCSSFKVRDQIPHQYKTAKIV